MTRDEQTRVCVDCGCGAGYFARRVGANGMYLAPVCHRHAGFPALPVQPSEFAFMESVHLLIDTMGIKDDGIRLHRLALDLETAAQRARETADAAAIQWTLMGRHSHDQG
jgi:hypothetical protein